MECWRRGGIQVAGFAGLCRAAPLAHNRLGPQNSKLTVNTTALVHETYVRLAEHPPHEVRDRNHFFAVAATVMRRVVVDQPANGWPPSVTAASAWSCSPT